MPPIGTVREIWRFPVKSMAGERLEAIDVGPGGLALDRGWALRDTQKQECFGAKRWPVLLLCTARYRDGGAAGAGTPGVPHVDITLPDGSRTASDAPDVHERLGALVGAQVTLEPLRPASDLAFYRRAGASAAVLGKLGKSKRIVRAIQGVMRATGADGEIRELFSREEGEPLPDLAEQPAQLLEFSSPPGTFFDAFPIHLMTTATLAAMAAKNPAAAWDPRRFRPNLVIETAPGMEGLVETGWVGRTLKIGGLRIKGELPTVRCGMTMHAQPGLAKDPTVLRTIVREADQNLGMYASVEGDGRVTVGEGVRLD